MLQVCCYAPMGRMAMAIPQQGTALTIRAPVGRGGANRMEDVRVVQTLLNRCGAQPQLNVDGFNGPKTMAAITAFQQAQFGWADSRVDPGQRTIARLNVLATPVGTGAQPGRNGGARSLVPGLILAPAAAPVAPPAPPPLTPVQAAKAVAPQAILWATAAVTHLSGVRIAGTPTAIANTHFHLDRDAANLGANVDKVMRVFGFMMAVFAQPDTYFTEGPTTTTPPSRFADASPGGFWIPGVRMTFRTDYPSCGPNTRTAMLLHEGAHFCGGLSEIMHFATEFPAPNGAPQDGSTRNYEQLTTSEAMRNASSYAAFAIHAFHGVDHRYGAANTAQ